MEEPTAMQVEQQKSEEEEQAKEEDLSALKSKLTLLKKRRQLLQKSRQEHQDLHQRLEEKCHDLSHQRELAIHEYRGWKLRHQQANAILEQSQRWNALNDGFFIWHQGPFATVNGVRLGAEAVVSSHCLPNHKTDETATPTTRTTAFGSVMGLPGRYLGFASTSATATTTTAVETTPTSPNNSNATTNNTVDDSTTPSTTTIKVPWTEINSALGQVVLLLKILESIPHAGISFPHHVLVPQGSTSKIGLRQPNAITGMNRSGEVPIVALYHLYSDDSFQLFGKRNFNLALRALTECLATAAACIRARDRTLVLPFAIQVEHDNPSAPCTIGGLPVQYPQPQDGVAWTRAMKYLLTNAKWCVAYAAKHVDR